MGNLINRKHHAAMFLLVAVAGMSSAAAQQNTPLQPAEMYKRVQPSVIVVEAFGPDGKIAKTGSGFLVSSDGRFITNYHVVQYCKRAGVRLANGDIYDNVEVLSVDKRRDIALLKIQAVDLPFLRLGRSTTVEVGHAVFSVSSPLGVLQNTLSQGIVGGIREMDGYKVFQMSAPISKGSSGGPVFNAAGEVIGISTFYFDGGQSLNFAVPIDYARGLMSSTLVQSLASIYEPEPEEMKPAPMPPSTPEPAKPQVASSVPIPVIPDEMKNGVTGFVEKHGLHAWALEDAVAVLGQPVRRRDALGASKQHDGDIYAFADPTRQFREIELRFDGYSKRATLLIFYPFDLTWDQCKGLWGENAKLTKNPNGTRFYAYQNRRVNVLTTKDGKVVNFGIY